MTHNKLNRDYYNNNCELFVTQTKDVNMSSLYDTFVSNLQNNKASYQYILDVGCGSGRDSNHFSNLGYKITAIDASDRLINWAQSNYRNNIDWQCLYFEEIEYKNWLNKFNGIWACASLLHIEYMNLTNIINILLSCLKEDGVLYLSFKYGSSERLHNERFFCDMNEERFQKINNQLTIKTKAPIIWITDDVRKDRNERWFNVILVKS